MVKLSTILFACFLFFQNANAQLCNDFNDTTMNVVITSAVTSFANFYIDNNGLVYSAKFADYTQIGNTTGTVDIYDMMGTGWSTMDNSNFDQRIMVLGDADVKIDFSNLAYSNKRIEFDISYSAQPTIPNDLNINNLGTMNPLPAGYSYTWTALTNGFHVILEGPINEVYFHGFEVAIDNLCVQQSTTTGIEDEQNISSLVQFIGDQIVFSSTNEIEEVTLFDLNGKELIRNSSSNRMLDISGLNNGVYILHFESGQRTFTHKFLKQ